MDNENENESIKGQEVVKPAEVLMKMVEANDKETAASIVLESLHYLLAKKDEIAEIVKDINTFLKQNKELVVLLDPAIMVSVSLRDPKSELSGLASIIKGESGLRDYAFEAALGRGQNLEAACQHIVEQLSSV